MQAPSTFLRVGLILVAAMLAVASAKPQASSIKTEKTGVFYEPRPKFEWRHRRGNTYRVVLTQLPRRSGDQRRTHGALATTLPRRNAERAPHARIFNSE